MKEEIRVKSEQKLTLGLKNWLKKEENIKTELELQFPQDQTNHTAVRDLKSDRSSDQNCDTDIELQN